MTPAVCMQVEIPPRIVVAQTETGRRRRCKDCGEVHGKVTARAWHIDIDGSHREVEIDFLLWAYLDSIGVFVE